MRSSDDSPLRAEDLTQLDDISLRQKWRRLIGRPMPDGLSRALVLRVLAFQQQVQRYGDLDLASRRALMNVLGAAQGRNLPADNAKTDSTASKAFRTSPLLRPGTVLTREHGGVLHHVMVMEKGYGWHGRTFDSLSKVAFAITGTRWNGPRFFGLRDKGESQSSSSSKVSGKQSATDRVGRDIASAQIVPWGIAAMTRPVLRCAIYTRVSSDQGLEQDFNSLQAQREAAEAYIKSQAHEGWKLHRDPLR